MDFNEEHWNKGRWAFSIGFFLMRFANIEDAVCQLKISLDAIKDLERNPLTTLKNEPPKSWHDLRIEEQADKLIRQLESISLEKYKPVKPKEELIKLLRYLSKIKDTRNALAHGAFFMKDGYTPERPNYCIFSRTQLNEKNEAVAEAKVIHVQDMESQISESTYLEVELTSYAHDLMRTLKLEAFPVTYELTFEARAREGNLSLLIGRFMVHMGEIERLVHMVYQLVLDPTYGDKYNSPIVKPNGYWDSLTLSRQVQDLLNRLPCTYEYSNLRGVISDLYNSELIRFRNILSHAKVCHQLSPTSESLVLVALRKTRKKPEIISASEITRLLRMVSDFSDSLDEALSIAEMSLMKPFTTG